MSRWAVLGTPDVQEMPLEQSVREREAFESSFQESSEREQMRRGAADVELKPVGWTALRCASGVPHESRWFAHSARGGRGFFTGRYGAERA